MNEAEEGEPAWDDVNEEKEGETAWEKDRVRFRGKLDVDVLIGSKTDNELKGGTMGGG